jgi:hypothetical protein
VHGDESGPRVPSWIETPGGAHVRDDRQQRERIDAVGPRSISVSQQSANDFRPPIAVATEAPTRSESFSITIPESNSAFHLERTS